ncbi:unnamed protein product [Peronospora belbahrii]|uniref:Cold shock domain-containing protein E1 n=1 Tax=Peronospora belbahrii TaxID=622444 RepID=A0ABN8DBA0_9STRA|nr:unnamed protein product [Peronospora belbahrii]
MFRSPKPGDWAAEDDDDASPLATPMLPSVTEATPESSESSVSRQDARDYERNNSGGRVDRSRGRFDRDRDNGGRFERDRDSGGRFERDRDGGGRFERDRDSGGRFERDRDPGGGGGRADAGRWGHNADRRGDVSDRRSSGRELPVEQGFVVSVKDNFGFVSCLEKEGDLFFHMSEAPVNIQQHDEVEFRVKYNQRSDKEIACQLVVLPKGTIKVEEVADELLDGVVTKSLPRGGHGNGRGFFNNRDDDRHQHRDEYGLIEVKKTKESDDSDDLKEAALEEQQQDDETGKKPLVRREFVRFTGDSVAVCETKSGDEDQGQNSRSKRNPIPRFGDEVRFRIAKHRKTGVKRAVDMTITLSARDKIEKEIEAKLATMMREFGVVNRVKNGGGFIKCCDRPLNIYFPFHEVRESAEADEDKKNDEKDGEKESGGNLGRSRQGKEPPIREGDEVSFFVYEDQEDESACSKPRLTALRVQKLPAGTVSFEELMRADVEGFVSKLPKESRSVLEVIGSITVTSVDPCNAESSEEAIDTIVETVLESEGKLLKKKGSKGGKAKKQKVAFQLCDVEDTSYVPHIGDEVMFDEVLDKRTGTVKAVKVRVVQLNPKNRETGIINAMKEDFGFIKCAERSGDAYFRFSDVMGTQRSFNNDTEVAFDVMVDSKSDHIRASRLQILPRGTVKWEYVAGEGLEGTIVAVPSSRRGRGRGDATKQLQKFVSGKIRFVAPRKQHLIDFLPDLKEKLDSAFITSEDVAKETQKVEEAEEDTSEETESKTEIRIAFPSTLSKCERAALHEYSDWLGLKHASSGAGFHRKLEIVGSKKVSEKTLQEKLATSVPELTVEFKEDDVDHVRYNPRVGDRVRFDLVVVKRTKRFRCKSISCLAAAASTTTKVAVATSDVAYGKGFIASLKPEGFGFIQPAETASGSLEENLFFHINEITTGQTLTDLKEGTEVRYAIFVDEKKKKKRATGISVLPAGTIKNMMPKSVKGVVTKASFLHRLKSGAKGRFTKANNTKTSTSGRIMLASAGSNAEGDTVDGDDDAGGNCDDEAEEAAEIMHDSGEMKSGDTETEELSTSVETRKIETKGLEQKASGKQFYLYNIRDIADPAIVLREGDEVEFVPQVTSKSRRAVHIRLVTSHAKQGIVTRIREDLGGVIRLDNEEPVVEARFTAQGVLRGDVLSEGDRVEFVYRPPSVSSIKNILPKSNKSGEKKVMSKDVSEENTEECGKFAAEPVLGHALSVLRLSSSSNSATTSQRRGSRMVNSTLKEAMRQVGANAMVASKMAKGPDGTRGFVEGWDYSSVETTDASVEKTTIGPSSTTMTTTRTTSCQRKTEQSGA